MGIQREVGMLDELERLRDNDKLFRLLDHYAQAGALDREVWQDRVMELEDVEVNGMVRLHGDLLAFAWIEQNTGVVPVMQKNAVPRCYRITLAGQRALKKAVCESEREDNEESLAA